MIVPELAVVRFIVRDHRGHFRVPAFVAEATLPIDCLRQGYRHLRLYAWNGESLAGKRRDRGGKSFEMLWRDARNLTRSSIPSAFLLFSFFPPLLATLFVHVDKAEGLRSRTWLSHHPRAPQALRQSDGEEAHPVNVGHADLDVKRAEIHSFLRKATKACERVGWALCVTAK